jgi:hypothetical protein
MQKNKINIIYILPAHKGASGGSKVIYQHSELINKFKIENISSHILHLKKKKIDKIFLSLKKRIFTKPSKKFGWNGNEMEAAKTFLPSSSWSKNKILIKNNMKFNPKSDFVILPEIWAHFANDLLIKKKIKYSIFVQGFYHMNSFYDHAKLLDAYNNAKFIITTSEETYKCLKFIFPSCKNKILKVNLSFNSKKFKIPNRKDNLITFMPRKLPDHFHILSLFLFNKLSKKWKMESLANLDEKNLFKKLCKSKIFLSFSYAEGFGMPPIEAALAGNKVIGYTGGGGKEYWNKPIFHEIQNGDIKKFSETILSSIKNFPKDWNTKSSKQRKKIVIKYSETNEKKLINKLINKISSYY